MSSGVASTSRGSTNELVPEDERNAEADNSIRSDDLSHDRVVSGGSGSSDSSDSSYSSDVERNEELEEEAVCKRPAIGTAETRSRMTDEKLGTKDLFHASMLQTKKIWVMAKMLHATKDVMRFTKDDAGVAIESKGVNLSTVDKKKRKEKFRKELVEKKKSLL